LQTVNFQIVWQPLELPHFPADWDLVMPQSIYQLFAVVGAIRLESYPLMFR
jgi:hypothetical protein